PVRAVACGGLRRASTRDGTQAAAGECPPTRLSTRFVTVKVTPHILRPTPEPTGDGSARDRVLQAVSRRRGLLFGRVPDGRCDARSGASVAPEGPAGREVHHLRVRLRPPAAFRANECPLLRLRPPFRDLRRRSSVH